MILYKKLRIAGSLILLLFTVGCGEKFLDVKNDQSLRIPTSVDDARALIYGIAYNNVGKELTVAGSDEYELSDGQHSSIRQGYKRNAYLWLHEVFEDADVPDWNASYDRIKYANLALEVLDRLGVNSKEVNGLMAMALFHRAYNYYNLSQSFMPPIQARELNTFGLPLRLESDVNVKIKRSTVTQTYGAIIDDLTTAVNLYGDGFESALIASKCASFALLSKVYLVMGQYEKALEYVGYALDIKNELMDYNDIDSLKAFPFFGDFGKSNSEIIFYDSNIAVYGFDMPLNPNISEIYDDNDLRRSVYFRSDSENNLFFKGTYTGFSMLFCGIAVDELFLLKAECQARLDNLTMANQTLNELLEKRYKKNAFVKLNIVDKKALLQMIMLERRRQLLLRGTRWEDLRRNGYDADLAEIPERTIAGKEYRLLPMSLKYIWPIPNKEIDLGKLDQNPR